MGSSKRFGVKKKGREIEEWFFDTSKKNAGFLGATGSDSHLTWLEDKEEDEISIHLTDQVTGEHRFLGRISKHVDEAEAELIIYSSMKPQLISDERFSEEIICITDKLMEYSDVPRSVSDKEQKRGKKLVEYFDEVVSKIIL
jgi:hypothetical protein